MSFFCGRIKKGPGEMIAGAAGGKNQKKKKTSTRNDKKDPPPKEFQSSLIPRKGMGDKRSLISAQVSLSQSVLLRGKEIFISTLLLTSIRKFVFHSVLYCVHVCGSRHYGTNSISRLSQEEKHEEDHLLRTWRS